MPRVCCVDEHMQHVHKNMLAYMQLWHTKFLAKEILDRKKAIEVEKINEARKKLTEKVDEFCSKQDINKVTLKMVSAVSGLVYVYLHHVLHICVLCVHTCVYMPQYLYVYV
jgi:hypothetical protein